MVVVVQVFRFWWCVFCGGVSYSRFCDILIVLLLFVLWSCCSCCGGCHQRLLDNVFVGGAGGRVVVDVVFVTEDCSTDAQLKAMIEDKLGRFCVVGGVKGGVALVVVMFFL